MSKFTISLAQAEVTTTVAQDDPVSNWIIPFITQLGFGGVIGFCAGFMVKKVGKFAAFIVGLLFVTLQVLAYYGVIQIDWAPIKEHWDKSTSPDQITGIWASVRSLLFANVPALAGAIPGFFLGLKAG